MRADRGGPGGIYADVEEVKARPDTSGRQALLFTEAAWSTPPATTSSPVGSAS